jgi:hypothetical protein
MTYEPLDEASSVALLAKDSFPNTYHPRVELGSKRLNADVSTNTLINLEDHCVSKDENEMFSEEVPSPNPNGKHPYAHMGSVTHWKKRACRASNPQEISEPIETKEGKRKMERGEWGGGK